MNSIKLTPFILFLFLLIILVISSLFGKRLMVEKEGLELDFQEGMTNTTSLTHVSLTTYSIGTSSSFQVFGPLWLNLLWRLAR
jgi:hypothetical protein